MESKKLIVTASPHITNHTSTRGLMLNVCIALLPALVASTLIFGARALLVTGVYIDAFNETAEVGGQGGRPRVAGQFVGKTSLDGVDAVAGATISSNAAMDAVQKAIDAFSTVKGA